MYEIYRDAPDKYITINLDISNEKTPENLFESEPETSPQKLPEPLPKNNYEPLQTQDPSELPIEPASTQKLLLIDYEFQNHLIIDKETDIPMLLLSTNLTLKSKRHMYNIPMDFEKLTLDGLIDIGALTNAISEQDLNKIKILAPEVITDTGPAPIFQTMVANEQLETPTVCLTFEVADFMFKENFIVMKVLPNPLIGLCFLKRNNAIFDIRQGVITFPHLSMQLKPEHNLPTRQSTPLLAKAAPLTTTDYCRILNPKADTQATKIPFGECRWIGPYKVEKVLPNKNYIVRRLGTNKTQLLHRIRLRKFTPSAPLADNIVRETDWQKDDNIIVTHDDLCAHTWDTNFGTDPFDTEFPDNEQDDIQEYEPINRPPSLEIPKKTVGGAPVEQITVPNEVTPTENAENEFDAIDNQQDLQPNPNIGGEKSPENTDGNQENDEVQKRKTPINTRGENYNLRPNPNPDFSDSYRY